MARNNSIQFLRGTAKQRAVVDEPLNPGQPFYEADTNKLFVGSNKPLKESQPISVAAEVIDLGVFSEDQTYRATGRLSVENLEKLYNLSGSSSYCITLSTQNKTITYTFVYDHVLDRRVYYHSAQIGASLSISAEGSWTSFKDAPTATKLLTAGSLISEVVIDPLTNDGGIPVKYNYGSKELALSKVDVERALPKAAAIEIIEKESDLRRYTTTYGVTECFGGDRQELDYQIVNHGVINVSTITSTYMKFIWMGSSTFCYMSYLSEGGTYIFRRVYLGLSGGQTSFLRLRYNTVCVTQRRMTTEGEGGYGY